MGKLVPEYKSFLKKQKESISDIEGEENVIVLCHNDVNTSNMIIMDSTGKLQLFDYEYAGYNYYYYEIANILCEFESVYLDEAPFFTYQELPQETVDQFLKIFWKKRLSDLNTVQKSLGGDPQPLTFENFKGNVIRFKM